MPDLADLAQIQHECLASLPRPKPPTGPEAIGLCLYCGEEVSLGLRWCNADCRNDWQTEEDRQRRQGSRS